MRRKLVITVLTGAVTVVLGTGIGIAAAQDGGGTVTPPFGPAGGRGFESMDEMHAAMRDEMPPDVAAACDEMHATMGDSMGSMMGGGGTN